MSQPPAQSLLNPVVIDPSDLKQLANDFLAAEIPGFEPATADPTDILLDTVAQMMSYGLAQYADPTTAIVRYVGEVVYGTPPHAAVSATGAVTFTTDGTAGTIDAGTSLGAIDADGQLQELQVAEDTIVTAGPTTVAAVPVIVVEPGAAGNDLDGTVRILDRLAFLESAVLDAPTANGVDAESDNEYRTRLAELTALIAPRPILPDDFAALARLLVPGVYRALAIDGYNADTTTTGVERCVTVAGQQSDGTPWTTDQKNAYLAAIAARREDTFLAFAIDQTTTAITVDFDGIAHPGFDAAAVETAAIQAVEDFLSPLNHGIPSSGVSTSWQETLIVRYQDVAAVLNTTPGFSHYTALTLNGGTADITLTGPAAVPDATVTGDVT